MNFRIVIFISLLFTIVVCSCGTKKNYWYEIDNEYPFNQEGISKTDHEKTKAFRKTKKELAKNERKKKKYIEKSYKIHRKNQTRKTRKKMKKERRKMIKERNKAYRKYKSR